MKALPEAFVQRMKQLLGEEEYAQYEASFQQPSERAFRVNTEKISVEDFAAINPFSAQPIATLSI